MAETADAARLNRAALQACGFESHPGHIGGARIQPEITEDGSPVFESHPGHIGGAWSGNKRDYSVARSRTSEMAGIPDTAGTPEIATVRA